MAKGIGTYLALLALASAGPALAQAGRMQSPAEAHTFDAAEYSVQIGVDEDEALRRLRAQEESVGETDRIRSEFADRLAGISIEHSPQYRILVLLTGQEPVPTRTIAAGGLVISVQFTVGATASYQKLQAAIRTHKDEVRSMLRRPPGMGIDGRTGEVVVTMSGEDAERYGSDRLRADIAALMGVPVRLRFVDRDLPMAVAGGSRVEGISPSDGRRYSCTTGFVVANGTRSGVITAAHCPDEVEYVDPQRSRTPLRFVGQWGWGYHDVQIHEADVPLEPYFYVDKERQLARPLTSWRNLASTRTGDMVCHRGETTGYSCAPVELTDFAPPGDLCGGPCEPTWVTVAGPSCRGGDSGGPVFTGTIAFGILKGGSYRADGSCNYYYYMSTDMLPDGWRLMTTGSEAVFPQSGTP